MVLFTGGGPRAQEKEQASAPAAAAAAKKVLTSETFLELRSVQDPQFSPDGTRVAFVVGDPPSTFALRVTPVIGLSEQLSCPVLGLFGNDDTYPSPAQMTELGAELDRLGKEYEFYFFEGAGHAFFAVDRPAYRPEAAKEGWAHIFRFLGKNLVA